MVFLDSKLVSNDHYTGIKTLGKGGYGSVILAKHKLDGRTYAIKQIRISEGGIFDEAKREVSTLAELSEAHNNIVRYFSCWISPEPLTCPRPMEVEDVWNEDIGNSKASDSSNDPNYCGYYLCIAMEVCEANLRQKMSSAISGNEHLVMVANYMSEIARTFAFCHKKGNCRFF